MNLLPQHVAALLNNHIITVTSASGHFFSVEAEIVRNNEPLAYSHSEDAVFFITIAHQMQPLAPGGSDSAIIVTGNTTT